jgi:hypothetical protein
VNYSFACCYPRTYTFKEITFINYAGLVRGPVCYGLSLLVSHEGIWKHTKGENQAEMTEMMESVVHNTVICNVILTTVIYGSFMSLVRDCLIKKSEKDEEEVTIENGKV